jgi:uncharacterized membrane protein HdeD (DUF308 family)
VDAIDTNGQEKNMNELAQASKNAKIWGWIVLIAGLLAVLSPLVSGLAVAVMVAVLLIVAGLTRVAHAFQGGGLWAGLSGGLATIAGLVMIGRPVLGLVSLTLILIVYFLAEGLAEIIAAFQARPAQGWGILLFGGIVSVVLSLLIWSQWPLSGAWAVGVLVGIQLMFSGMTMIAIGSVIKDVAAA